MNPPLDRPPTRAEMTALASETASCLGCGLAIVVGVLVIAFVVIRFLRFAWGD